MIQGGPHRPVALLLALAFVSGVPALVYEVVWTRQVALLAGGQVEAISVVLVAFFGGLAAGARVLGARADRWRSPLRAYGALEIAGGALAAFTPALFSILDGVAARLPEPTVPFAAAALLLPTTFVLGGTLPALLRAAVRELPDAARSAGRLVGVNTAGAVAGVGVAALAIPAVGLRATLFAASALAIAAGLGALLLGAGASRPRLAALPAPGPPRRIVLAAAALAGVATLAFEVLAARMAALRLGSSLAAWAMVLGLILTGLAVGNAALARRAARSPRPEAELGWIELAAAAALVAGLRLIAPAAAQASGLGALPLLEVGLAVLPAALCMGAAFPYFVRLAVSDPALGAAFGAVSAANTAGGIAGALLAPFVLLPALGPAAGALACAALNAALALLFLVRGSDGWAQPALGAAGLTALALAVPAKPAAPGAGRLLFFEHGRQASAAVLHMGDRRELLVDGDPEASTGGAARRTEELLAALPLVIHPAPRSLLEIGLGSGITLGTAARFPLERIECVEIAASVLAAARFFEPDNRGVLDGEDPRVRVVRGDGRLFLARSDADYDVVLANTLHPWSVGATGLYSREYFARIAAALAPGGIAAQWLPVERIDAQALGAILRTFFDVFEEGGVWWGAHNLIALGSRDAPLRLDPARAAARLAAAELAPARLGLDAAGDLGLRRLADADAVRAALGAGPLLRDDRPLLEGHAARARAAGAADALGLALRIAEAGAAAAPLRNWIASLRARALGDETQATALAARAEAAGWTLAREAKAERLLARAGEALAARRGAAAAGALRAAAAAAPRASRPHYALAAQAHREGRREAADRALDTLLEAHPDHAPGWVLAGVIDRERGDPRGALRSFERALAADPFLPEALANAGIVALELGDRTSAERHLARLRASPDGGGAEAHALAAALSATPPVDGLR